MAIVLNQRTHGADGKMRDEYIMDSTADFANLPKSNPGSVAYTVDSEFVMYMVNPSGEWKEV